MTFQSHLRLCSLKCGLLTISVTWELVKMQIFRLSPRPQFLGAGPSHPYFHKVWEAWWSSPFLGKGNIVRTMKLGSDLWQFQLDGDDVICCPVEKTAWLDRCLGDSLYLNLQPHLSTLSSCTNYKSLIFSFSLLIQHCHPPSSFLHELNNTVTCAYLPIYMKIRFLIFWELYSDRRIIEGRQDSSLL